MSQTMAGNKRDVRGMILRCGFRSINADFLRKSSIDKGRNLLRSGHVLGVAEIASCEEANCEESGEGVGLTTSKITAKVLPQTSIRNSAYLVELQLNSGRQVTEATCECQAGLGGKCKHVAAAFLYVNEEETESCTSKPQAWGGPTQNCIDKYKKGHTIQEMFKRSALKEKERPKKINANDIIRSNINCPLRNILIAEQEEDFVKTSFEVLEDMLDQVVEVVGNDKVKDMFPRILKNFWKLNLCTRLQETNIYSLSVEAKQFYQDNVFLTDEKRLDICQKTRAQSQCPEWFVQRHLRITASNAHSVVTRKGNYDKLTERFLTTKTFSNEATRYGTRTEKTAKDVFSASNGVSVVDFGMLVCPSKPWLACSPDGLYINSNGEIELLEIKCPYTCAGKKTRGRITEPKNIVDFETQTANVPYIQFKDGVPALKYSHQYYTQVQCMLYILGARKCSFVVYSELQTLVCPVFRNGEFLLSAVCKMEQFYFTYLLPKLYDINCNKYTKLKL